MVRFYEVGAQMTTHLAPRLDADIAVAIDRLIHSFSSRGVGTCELQS